MTGRVSRHEKGGTLLLCDFDGTLSPTDMGYGVLNRFSAPYEWERINRAYENENIGSREAYRRLEPYFRATRDEMLRYVIAHGSLDPNFTSFYRFCLSLGYDFIILSDGLDFYIDALLKKYGLEEIGYYANRVVFHDDGAITIEFPHRNETCGRCGNCKRSILHGMRGKYKEIVYIGDGHSDLCPAKDADTIFARDLLYSEYRAMGKECFYYNDFSDIHAHFENMLSR